VLGILEDHMIASAGREAVWPIATWKVVCQGDHIEVLGQSRVLDVFKKACEIGRKSADQRGYYRTGGGSRLRGHQLDIVLFVLAGSIGRRRSPRSGA
jgi:hypothetical protein